MILSTIKIPVSIIMEHYLRNFKKVYSRKIFLHKIVADADTRLVYGHYRRLYIVDANDIPQEVHRHQYINYMRYERTTVYDNLFKFYSTSNDIIIYPYIGFKTVEEMSNEPIKDISSKNYFRTGLYLTSSMIVKLERVDGDYFIDYYINNKIIKNILDGKRERKQMLLYDLLELDKKDDMMNECKETLHILQQPVIHLPGASASAADADTEADSLLKEHVRLFDYQMEDIKWMRGIESDIENKRNVITHHYSLKEPVLDDQFVLFRNDIFPAWVFSGNEMRKTTRIEYHGGNIISKVGLGKTLICLYHILYDGLRDREIYDQFVEFGEKCNYMFKRGSQKGSSCQSQTEPSELYCKQHRDTLFIEKRVLTYKNLDRFNAQDFITSGGDLIKTNASLVVCPNQLCDQWIKEYYDKFINNRRVVLIITKDQFLNVTLADLLFADVVVVSYQFLINPFYFSKVDYGTASSRLVRKEYLAEYFKTDHDNEPRQLLNSQRFNSLHLFHWRKIMLDEVHEIKVMTKGASIKRIVRTLSAGSKWNVTGTPFANGIDGFFDIVSYNTRHVSTCTGHADTDGDSHDETDEEIYYDDYYTKNITDHSVSHLIAHGINHRLINSHSHLFRCNTKDSIRNEFAGNIISETVKPLTFTQQERAMYDSHRLVPTSPKHFDFLIRMCCHIELSNETKELVKNCKTLDEIQEVMLGYHQTQMMKEETTIRETEADIANSTAQLEDPNLEEYIRENLTTRLGILRRRLTVAKTSYNNIERAYTYLKNAIASLHVSQTEEEETCPICLEVISPDDMSITKCGHKFCWECISAMHSIRYNDTTAYRYRHVVDEFKCPSCNSLLSHTDVFLLSDEQPRSESSQNEESVDDIVSKVRSTKVGHIIHYLKTQIAKDDKVILFSQWDEMLHRVGEMLAKYNIRIVYCNGTVFQRKRAIDIFTKSNDINIIMLSSRNAASGINLTVANKILLLEPVYGDTTYRENIESQAVGRADRIGQKREIEVVRFIIEDTIEEDIINNNIDTSKIRQLWS
jgi:SNF2 family DNA or RNA helicase